MNVFLILSALGATSVLLYYGYLVWRSRQAKPEHTLEQPALQPKLPPIAGSGTGWFKVLAGAHLLEHCKAHSLLSDIERQSRLSHEVFMRDMYPAIEAYAEFVQLSPASEAHHHSHIGGLIAHTLEVVCAALTYRNGYLLPIHATPETIDAQRDHWTYAAFYAALLHDVGKVLTDLHIDVRDTPQAPARRWMPLSGALTASRATEYEIRFAPKSERDYQAHQRLSLVMLQAIVPQNALAFMGREQRVLTALTKYLSGDEGITDEGAKALSEIVKKADSYSVARNLTQGPRHRFVTATAVPLNELLMQAIRHMLRDGTKLPLNRNGAAGWVYDGAIWFVAKRLADTVRKHIQEHHPDESIPGGNKNDRLFDVWQDYGLVEPNPDTKGAIWRVVIQGPDFELPPFPVLKFPLHKLFESPSQYPVAMEGRIEILTGEQAIVPVSEVIEAVAPEAAADLEQAPTHTEPTPSVQKLPTPAEPKQPKTTDEAIASHLLSAAETERPQIMIMATMDGGAPIFARGEPDSAASRARQPVQAPTAREGSQPSAAATTPQQNASVVPSAVPAPRPVAQKPTSGVPAPKVGGAKAPLQNLRKQEGGPKEEQQPSGAKAASAPITKQIQDSTAYQGSATRLNSMDDVRFRREVPGPVEAQASEQMKPVVPQAKIPKVLGKKTDPDPIAIEFMQWVQQGLASGSMSYNAADSMIHIVPEGIALVSPRIFREFSAYKSLDDDLAVQKIVIAAGWHRVGQGHSNILHYQIVSNGKRKGKLSAVVLHNPGVWLAEVPPPNPFLVPFQLTDSSAKTEA